jgi:hypothetical protein
MMFSMHLPAISVLLISGSALMERAQGIEHAASLAR